MNHIDRAVCPPNTWSAQSQTTMHVLEAYVILVLILLLVVRIWQVQHQHRITLKKIMLITL
jgi:hypothetical protein